MVKKAAVLLSIVAFIVMLSSCITVPIRVEKQNDDWDGRELTIAHLNEKYRENIVVEIIPETIESGVAKVNVTLPDLIKIFEEQKRALHEQSQDGNDMIIGVMNNLSRYSITYEIETEVALSNGKWMVSSPEKVSSCIDESMNEFVAHVFRNSDMRPLELEVAR